jgi:hypothetical protein
MAIAPLDRETGAWFRSIDRAAPAAAEHAFVGYAVLQVLLCR